MILIPIKMNFPTTTKKFLIYYLTKTLLLFSILFLILMTRQNLIVRILIILTNLFIKHMSKSVILSDNKEIVI